MLYSPPPASRTHRRAHRRPAPVTCYSAAPKDHERRGHAAASYCAAYGAGKVMAHEQDGGSLGALVAGLAIAVGCFMLAARYNRRRRARRLPAEPAPKKPAENSADTGR
jgi:hypothetical protein